jgi:hypothetical protein
VESGLLGLKKISPFSHEPVADFNFARTRPPWALIGALARGRAICHLDPITTSLDEVPG